MTIASPCTGVCRMNRATALCDGCARTIEEIVAWGAASDARKAEILAALPGRASNSGTDA